MHKVTQQRKTKRVPSSDDRCNDFRRSCCVVVLLTKPPLNAINPGMICNRNQKVLLWLFLLFLRKMLLFTLFPCAGKIGAVWTRQLPPCHSSNTPSLHYHHCHSPPSHAHLLPNLTHNSTFRTKQQRPQDVSVTSPVPRQTIIY